jgi:hypothetical protein
VSAVTRAVALTVTDESFSHGEAMVAVADALHRRLDEASENMIRLAGRERPRGVTWGPMLEAEVRSAMRTTAETAIALIAGDRRLSPEEEAMLRLVAARRARQGVPLESMKASVRVALKVLWDRVVSAAAALPPSSETTTALGRVGTLLAHLGDAATAALEDGYDDDGRGRSGDRDEARGHVLADLLSGALPAESLADELKRVNVDPTVTHGLLLVAAPVPHADRGRTRAAADSLVSSMASAVQVPLTSVATGHVSVLVSTDAAGWRRCSNVARAATESAGVVVFAAPPCNASQLSQSYSRAVRLLQVAQTLRLPPQVLDPRDLRLPSLLAETSSERRPFIDEILGPVLALPCQVRDAFLATIHVLNDAGWRGGVSAAAIKLKVHEKTIYYRLNRIRKLTGLDYNVATDRTQLTLAAELLRLPGAAMPQEAQIMGLPVRQHARSSATGPTLPARAG